MQLIRVDAWINEILEDFSRKYSEMWAGSFCVEENLQNCDTYSSGKTTDCVHENNKQKNKTLGKGAKEHNVFFNELGMLEGEDAKSGMGSNMRKFTFIAPYPPRKVMKTQGNI